MSLIRLIDAGYKYSGTDKWVFRHFSIEVKLGEVVRVGGRNGSGKTTLLKTLGGLLNLTEGKLLREMGAKVAYMDQFAGEMMARDLTIAEQLKAVAIPHAQSSVTSIERLEDFGLGLQDRLNEFIGHLSGGQRQVIALLSTLLSGSNVICLDEFTSSLDDKSAGVANGLLTHIRTVGETALLLVTHGSIDIPIDRECNMTSG